MSIQTSNTALDAVLGAITDTVIKSPSSPKFPHLYHPFTKTKLLIYNFVKHITVLGLSHAVFHVQPINLHNQHHKHLFDSMVSLFIRLNSCMDHIVLNKMVKKAAVGTWEI